MRAFWSALPIIAVFLAVRPLVAQDEFPVDSGGEKALRNHLERSLITFGGGLGNGPKVWFEGNIAPHFVVADANRFALVLTPKVILRMMRTSSAPVRTPSYMPRVTGYYQLHARRDTSQYLFLTVSHHSNGQDGPFFNPDGSVNEHDGSFSTNFVEFGLQEVGLDSLGVGSYRASIEYHPAFAVDENMRDRYSQLRLHLGGAYSFADWTTGAIDVTYLADPTPYTKRVLDRFQLGANITITSKFFNEIAFLINAYHGQDYYNIQFTHRVTMLRLGISTKPSRDHGGPVALTR